MLQWLLIVMHNNLSSYQDGHLAVATHGDDAVKAPSVGIKAHARVFLIGNHVIVVFNVARVACIGQISVGLTCTEKCQVSWIVSFQQLHFCKACHLCSCDLHQNRCD